MVFALTRDPRLVGLRRTLLRLGRYQPCVRGFVSRGAHLAVARPPALLSPCPLLRSREAPTSLDDAHPAAPPPSHRTASTLVVLPPPGARVAAPTLVPTSRFRTSSPASSALRPQVCCALLPVLGFTTLPAVRTRTAARAAHLSVARPADLAALRSEIGHIAAFPAMPLPPKNSPRCPPYRVSAACSLPVVPRPAQALAAGLPHRRLPPHRAGAPNSTSPWTLLVGGRLRVCGPSGLVPRGTRSPLHRCLRSHFEAPDCSGPSGSLVLADEAHTLLGVSWATPRVSSFIESVVYDAVAGLRTPCPFHGLVPSRHDRRFSAFRRARLRGALVPPVAR